MTIDNICKCVNKVRFIVECAALTEPDDFIFNAIKTRKIMKANMAAKRIKTMPPLCSSQLTHVPNAPPLGAAKLGAHCEQRKLRLLFKTWPVAHDSFLDTAAKFFPLLYISSLTLAAPRHEDGRLHFVKINCCGAGQRDQPKRAFTSSSCRCLRVSF